MRTRIKRYTSSTTKLFDKLIETGMNSRQASMRMRELEFRNEMRFATI